jgi:hypothetical protein
MVAGRAATINGRDFAEYRKRHERSIHIRELHKVGNSYLVIEEIICDLVSRRI